MDPSQLSPWETDQCYNGLDICVTHDVFAATIDQLDEHTRPKYEFSKALQAPVLEMRLRGCLVDLARRADVIDMFFEQMEIIEAQLNRIVFDGVGMLDFNWRSPKLVGELFYSHLGLPKGRNGSTDRTARERLEVYPIAEQIVKHINILADLGKKVSALKTDLDNDNRIRTSYNIAGTSTARFSSSQSEFGAGGNLQNIEESLRSIFIADPGMKFAKFDAKSGESYCVGAIEWNLFNDPTYLDAVESGDVHTAVARICWPNLPWTGDLNKDKSIAEQPYYRHYTYRFMCKKLGHGSNYGGQPQTLSEQSKLPINVVADFQPKYFGAFPAHQRWHNWVDATLRSQGCLVSLMGRKRHFFKRRSEAKTLREAIAYDPQSSLADIVNTALINLWRLNIAIVMFQDHDALTFMYPEKNEAQVVAEIQRHLVVPVELNSGRILRIPYDCKTGWNKGDYSEKNPGGLKDFYGEDKRKRPPKINVLDRILHGGNGRT
jgi:DNA polymerase I-like protein with 3'-5' exonuclease and polymerase domains